MKNTVLALIAFLAVSVSAFAQDNETKENIKYSNITEFGFFTASPRSFAFEGTMVHGVSIDKQHHLGLGIGIGWNNCHSYRYSTAHMPMFVNYRYYFSPNKKFSPHFNVALGGVAVGDGGGIYSALTAGFRAGKFSFSSGLSFMAVYREEMWSKWYNTYPYPYDPYNSYMPDGYSINYYQKDWHFPFGIVIKCGFTF